ncbi:START domain-containing protein [Aliiglaciecola litoralis]|uniref:START domain-containing protein n=1 Tax=Aliiglaciecola litoralis TaxID=582857 RepID=A0ABN1LR87_9ALTE
MKPFTPLSLGLLVSLFISASVLADTADLAWEVATQKQGISVFTRATASGYKEIKASMTINAHPMDFVNLLENIALAPQWIANCRKVELLEKRGNFERVVKSTFSAPWPVQDREMVTYSFTSIDPNNGKITIDISDMSQRYPDDKDDDNVRMLNVSGQWKLLKLENGLTTLSYQGYGEPAGNLPIWLSNQLVVSSVYTTFNNLREILQK